MVIGQIFETALEKNSSSIGSNFNIYDSYEWAPLWGGEESEGPAELYFASISLPYMVQLRITEHINTGYHFSDLANTDATAGTDRSFSQ